MHIRHYNILLVVHIRLVPHSLVAGRNSLLVVVAHTPSADLEGNIRYLVVGNHSVVGKEMHAVGMEMRRSNLIEERMRVGCVRVLGSSLGMRLGSHRQVVVAPLELRIFGKTCWGLIEFEVGRWQVEDFEGSWKSRSLSEGWLEECASFLRAAFNLGGPCATLAQEYSYA